MKRLLAIGAALAIALAPIAPEAQAASVKPGGACSKIGQTKVLGSKKYTCVKSASKKVWNRGVVIAKPKPVTPPAPSKAVTFDNLDVALVRKLAWAEVHKGVLANPDYAPKMNFIVGPSLSQSRVDQERAGLNLTAKFWSDLYKPNETFIGYFTEKDVDWVDAAMCAQAGYCPTGMSPVISQVIKLNPYACNSAQATQNQFGQPFFNQCLGTGSEAVKNRQTGPHEYTHWMQFAYLNWSSAPNWWVEGSAAYFGGALGLYSSRDLPDQLDEVIHVDSRGWFDQDLCSVKELTTQQVAQCFRYTYRQGTPPAAGQRYMLAHVSYYMGALATEAMLAVKGLETYKTFIRDLQTLEFDAAFAKHYQITADAFFEKVSPYVIAMYRLGK